MAIRATSGTTVANTAGTVTFANWYPLIKITNRSTTAGQELWVRADGTAATVAGDECDVVPPNTTVIVANGKVPPDQGAGQASNTAVSVIATAAGVNFTVASA